MNRTLMIDGIQPHGDGVTNGFRFLLIESHDLPIGAELDALDENDPVQVAIFELEALADWWIRPDDGMAPPCLVRGLAATALDEAERSGFETYPFQHLKAAALLRDGWRP